MNSTELKKQIDVLSKKIEEQSAYCRDNIVPGLKVVTSIVATSLYSSYPWWKAYKYERLKIMFYGEVINGRKRTWANSKRTCANSTRIHIVMKYKYRKVFDGFCSRDASYIAVREFHACEWTEKFAGLCEYISTVTQLEIDKTEHKKLKNKLKGLASKYVEIQPYCETKE